MLSFSISKHDPQKVKSDADQYADRIDDGSNEQIFFDIFIDAEKHEKSNARA